MKKLLLAGTVALSLGTTTNASAIVVDITSMNFGSVSTASGRISTDNLGATYTGTFFGAGWTATTVSAYETVGAHIWTGTSPQGAFSYSFTLSQGQYAWGTYFNWSTNVDIVILNTMDCSNGVSCIGIGTPMQTGPFIGQAPSFNGVVVSAVPVPAAAWLFGSGLIGLFSLNRVRRKADKMDE